MASYYFLDGVFPPAIASNPVVSTQNKKESR